ncbi:FecR family protein [Mucilaginibacter kameinonensis]|uniref:FecR family protein n=1 Tax=Mucilaginibacter kameinonensis TaxID=452286 RepID=UPI000EF83D72|nr:FecR domain-containing protein [Mucilaginibacter kameinonensis]
MEEQKLKILISKYNSGAATPEERMLIENWYESLNGAELSKSDHELEEIKQDTFSNLQTYIGTFKPNQYPAQNNKVILLTYVKWIAAAVLLSISITFYYYKQHSIVQQNNVIAKNDIAPGGNKAILTLADGSKLVLDDTKNGKLATQGKTIVQKTGSGMLAYLSSALGSNTSEVTYNTVTTPRGGQYNVVLPDGTQVWLNAASSLKFPTTFTGKERSVELIGEAYFEVAKNKAMPFHVSSAGQTIEVLGTHFNVNTYSDETALKTTLFEGSVKITKGTLSAMLKPGQQSTISNNETATAIKVTEVTDIDEIMAWKNGKFHFNDTDIKTVMRQISRWYDVDIEYTGKLPDDDVFTGTFPRSLTAAKALKILEFSGVNFKIEGRKIIVK